MEAITTTACVAFLAIATLAVTRARREPIASRFAALCVILFAYTTFDLLRHLSPLPAWRWLTDAAAAMCTPFFFHFAMTFLGQRKERRRSIAAFYVYFGVLAAACLQPIILPGIGSFLGERIGARLLLAGIVPAATIGTVRLVQYARRQLPQERARAALVLGAVLVAACGTATDLVAIAGSRTPRIAVGSLVVSAGFLGIAAIKTRVLERVSWLVALNAIAVAFAVVLGQLALFRWVGDRSALLAVGSVIIALIALLSGRFLSRAMTEASARLREQAARGRMSKQLAHDLRNPLTAVRGAAQLLESAKDRLTAEERTYISLIVKNCDRTASLITRYERLAKMEPELKDSDVNELVDAALATLKVQTAIGVSKTLQIDLSKCALDPELVTEAIANVLRNASEALDGKGHIDVSTHKVGAIVTVEIKDNGPGMDARTREEAFNDFFTTKPNGSGLGLAFVQRVMVAHSGRVTIDSTLGKGTQVTLELPLASA